MIHVIATIEIVAGRREDFLAEFRKIIPAVRAEEGCLEYGPTIDLETNLPAQGGVRNNVVTIVEIWDSLEALERHLIAPHMVAYRPRVRDLVQSSRLQILQPV
jgi:quinol monooxygenase YgiN